VDVLFIDEAGQMSLADVLAVSQAGKKLVLLGDPQQLERADERKPSGWGGKIGIGTSARWAEDDSAGDGIPTAGDLAAASEGLPIYFGIFL